MSTSVSASREGPLDEEALTEIKMHLKKQQEGLNTLIDLLKDDFQDLKLIDRGLTDEDSALTGMPESHARIFRSQNGF